MLRKGYNVISEGKMMTFVGQEGVMGPSSKFNDEHQLWIMNIKPIYVQQKALAAREAVGTLQLLHQRLAHCDVERIKESIRSNAVEGIVIKGAEKFFCEPCVLGKQTRLPYPPVVTKRKTIPGQFAHVDTAGPTQPSNGKNRYFFLIKDDATGFRTVYLMQHKSEAADNIMDYIKFSETQTGNKFKTLRSDNGSEIVNGKLNRFMANRGIIHETSVEYCAQMNGAIEKEIRTLKDTARTMMQAKNLPHRFWGEAVCAAAYIRNRILDKQSEPGKTAYESFFKRKPNLSHARVFGSDVYVHKDKEVSPWTTSRSTKMLFVGYDSITNAYRCHDPKTNTVGTFRNVRFVEDITVSVVVTKEEVAAAAEEEEPIESDGQPSDNTDDTEDENGQDHDESDLLPDDAAQDDEDQVPDDTIVARESSDTDIGDADGHHVEEPQWASRAEHKHGQQKDDERVLELEVKTPDGQRVIVEAPLDGPSTVELPVGDGSTRKFNITPSSLRPTDKLKLPLRYRDQANVASLNVTDEPYSYQQAVASEDAAKWKEAMENEMRSHEKNQTWSLVARPPNAKLLKSRWVYKIKHKLDGSVDKYKARLVVKGCGQRPGVDYNLQEIFAPVARNESIRLLLSLAAERDWELGQLDIETAYLHGVVDRDIYMERPDGYHDGNSGLVCKLNKTLYGLSQSPKAWNDVFTTFLQQYNFTPIASDPCVFVGKACGEQIIFALYVDDVLFLAPTQAAISDVINTIKSKFTVTVGKAKSFVGFEIHRDKGGITLTQTSYIKTLLERFGMADAKPAVVPMTIAKLQSPSDEHTNEEDYPYQQLIGALIYLSTKTRPDIAFAVSKLSRFMSNFSSEHWNAAKHVLRYLSRQQPWSALHAPRQWRAAHWVLRQRLCRRRGRAPLDNGIRLRDEWRNHVDQPSPVGNRFVKQRSGIHFAGVCGARMRLVSPISPRTRRETKRANDNILR